MKQLLAGAIEAVLEEEIDGARRAGNSARRPLRPDCHDLRRLVTRIGVLDLLLPANRGQRLSFVLFTRYPASENTLLASLTKMVLHGSASSRTAHEFAQELCGHTFDFRAVMRIARRLDTELARFMRRQLEEEYPASSVRGWTHTHAFGFWDD